MAFTNRALRPGDHLRGQDASDLKFFAVSKKQGVDAGRVAIGQFRQIADSHHHRHIGRMLPQRIVAMERFGETTSDRFKDRIEPVGDLVIMKKLRCLHETFQPRLIHVRNNHYLGAPVDRLVAVAPVDRQ
ncbi:MAG: hypothetical protein ACK5O5_01115, partial [bacterium]